MRAFVVASNVRIAPFGDLARDLPVGHVALCEEQRRLFRRFGLEVVEVESLSEVDTGQPCIVTYDNVYFTRRVLKSFLKLWDRGKSARLALPVESTFVQKFSELQDLVRTDAHAMYRFWGLAAGASAADVEDLRAPVEVIYKERLLELDVPSHVVGMESWVHPVTSSVCLQVDHWIHVLFANVLSIQVRWVDHIVTHPFWTASRVLLGALPGRGRLMHRVARRANVRGKNVDIHPTALVEGCIIGDDVTIGPQATVRGSLIGRGVRIDQRADVTFSVIGEECFVSKHSIVNGAASLPGADLCAKGLQMSLIGRNVGLGARVNLMDTMPGGQIKVQTKHGLKALETKVLGCCVGHDVWIGPDVYVAPGRAIPNGARFTMAPGRIVAKFPDEIDPDKIYFVRNSTLSET